MKRDVLALAFAMIFPGVMAWLYFVALAAETPAGAPAGAGRGPALEVQVAFAVGKAVQFGFPLAFVWWCERQRLRAGPLNLRGLVFGVSFGLLVSAGILGLYHFWLGEELARIGAPAKIRGKLEQFGLDTPGGFLLLASFIALIHSALEEYYWRWFVFGWLKRYLPVTAAIVLSSLAFMVHHLIVLAAYLPGTTTFFVLVVPLSLCVAVGGAIWAWLYHRTGSIYSPWVSHLLIDAALMAVGYEMVFAG